MTDQAFPEPTVGAFIFNHNDELLLLKSHKWPGMYVVPGGHVELGERIEEAVIRETKEETELVLNDEAEEYVWVQLEDAVHLLLDAYTRASIGRLIERHKG